MLFADPTAISSGMVNQGSRRGLILYFGRLQNHPLERRRRADAGGEKAD
jgi:hypothetical protein